MADQVSLSEYSKLVCEAEKQLQIFNSRSEDLVRQIQRLQIALSKTITERDEFLTRMDSVLKQLHLGENS
jgi:hypothetical protein